MKLIKFVLPVMFLAFTAVANDDCRVYSPIANQGSVDSDGVWLPTAASAQS